MNYKKLKLKTILALIIFFSFFCVVGSSEAAITFTDGKWETTFDCAEQAITTSINCNNMSIYLEQTASDPTENSKIEAGANNPLGTGNGFSRIDGWGDVGFGGGVADNSASIATEFPTPEKEIWIRAYIRYPSNWYANPFIAVKTFFVRGDGNTIQALVEPNSTGFRVVAQGLTSSTADNTQTTFKYSDMFTTGTYVGDNTWHCVETHLKMDTNGVYGAATADGIAQVWVDDVLRVNSTTVNYSKGDVTSRNGWTDANVDLNQNKLLAVDANLARVFVDDIVVYNTTPPNTDAEGNPYIGPISDTTPPVVEIIAPVSAEEVDLNTIIFFSDDEETNPECSLDETNWTNCVSGNTSLGDLTGWEAISNGSTFILYLRDTDEAENTGTDSVTNLTKIATSGTKIIFSPEEDTYINLNAENKYNSTQLNTYTWPIDKIANAILMKFNLDTLPESITIHSAKLYLYQIEAGGDASYTLSTHRIINYNPDLTQTNGYFYDGINAWSPYIGCYNDIPLAQADIALAASSTDLDLNLGTKVLDITNIINDWQSGIENYGLLINSDPDTTLNDSYRYFASSENSISTWHPRLVIDFSSSDITPPAHPQGLSVQ